MAIIGIVSVAAAACSGEDKNRPLSFEPGVYHGVKMPELSADEQQKLRQRGELQR